MMNASESCAGPTSTSSSTSTPVRHNYAAPHTPIASAKRPRQSMERTTPRASALEGTTAPHTPSATAAAAAAENLSPLHPPRPVPSRSCEEDAASQYHSLLCAVDEEAEKEEVSLTSSWDVSNKVGALFSPVLTFLNGTSGSSSSTNTSKDDAVTAEEEEEEEEEIAQITDEGSSQDNTDNDVAMEDTSAVTATPPKPMLHHHPHHHHHHHHGHLHHHGLEDVIHEASSSEPPSPEEPDDDDVVEDVDDDEEEFNPYLFIKTLPRYALVQNLRPPVALPPKDRASPPITLVLDLDETLVHCTVEPVLDSDLIFPVVFHGMEYQVHVRLRPHLFEFLERIHGHFEVVVFTASQKVYANELLDRIDPSGKYIQHRMFRESCLAVEGNFLKDLTVLGRDLSKTVLVDNSPHAFGYQPDNGIPIESWFDDPQDTELLKLELFLRQLNSLNDVRSLVRAKFETWRKVAEA